jgi:hypothetical protein
MAAMSHHLYLVTLLALPAADPPRLPTPQEMAAARTDVWGEAALKHPDGPSYEFFKDLLPPLRYVNTAFKHYPIVLSAPLAPVKARWVSNGSGVNLRADKPPMWKEAGTPVAFFVGDKDEQFGADVERLRGPWYAKAAPMLVVHYKHEKVTYTQVAFTPVREPWADHGAVFLRFSCTKGEGRLVARIGTGERFTVADGAVKDAKGNTVALFGSGWIWNGDRAELVSQMGGDPSASAELVVLTKPAPIKDQKNPVLKEVFPFFSAWEDLLGRGTDVKIPEPLVQNAWRALVVGQYLTAVGDRMHYSAGNAYDHLYEGECGDAVRSLMLFGQTADARKMVGPLLDFNRQATRFHVAGHKLQLLTHHYWVTRDKDGLAAMRPKWEPVVQFIRDSRKTDNGLLPKDRYAGDINEQVYSLNSNAACWRGLRDMAAVYEDLGAKEKAAELHKEAGKFRQVILDAVTKSQDNTARFVPMSLLANEKPHDPLTATRTGSYYDLMIPYVLGSGVFGPGDEREGWIIEYLRNHGGIAMGMIRSMPHQGEFNNEPGVNVLYGLRYNLTLLRRGDRDHALVGFYGHLAQAMTRDTFIGGEGSRFLHGDKHGRSFYLPPNSASNATFLTTLRYLLIQDWDLDDDGTPETLRLLDAIPPRWLKDGTTIEVKKAPTVFGEVSFRVQSRLDQGEVVVDVKSPPRPVGKWQVRLPDPPGYQITGVRIGDDEAKRDDDGRVDLTGRMGDVRVRFTVAKR